MIALAALTGASCRHTPPPEPEPPLPPQVNETEPPIAPSMTTPEGSYPRFWREIFQEPEAFSESGEAFSAHGYTIDWLEYGAGLRSFQEANPDLGVERAKEEYEQQLTRDLLLLRWLRSEGLPGNEQLRAEVRHSVRRAIAESIIEEELEAVTAPEQEIRRLYNDRIDEYREPAKVEIRMILIPTEQEAREVLDRITAGEEFGELARELSRHESSVNGGRLEPFARGEANRELEERAFALEPGEAGIVTTAAGSFVIQKIANIASFEVPFEEVRDELERELLERRKAAALENFLIQVRRELNGQK